MMATGLDSAQLGALIDAYQPMLLRLCCLYLHDVHLAEDAVQETFIKAVRGWDDFRGEASVKTWLTSIAMHTCIDMRRSFWFRRVDRRVALEDLPAPIVDTGEEERALTLAVMKLPHRLREAVILYYYQDMSEQEIAQLLHIGQPGVANRLKRAREKLKEYLAKEGAR